MKYVEKGTNKLVEAKRGIYVYDDKGNEYEIVSNKLGELIIRATDGRIVITPQVSNEIIIETK